MLFRHSKPFVFLASIGQPHMLWLFVLVTLSSCAVTTRTSHKSYPDLPADFYAIHSARLGFKLQGNENPFLIEEVSSWKGVPYRYGGISRQGADCSGFVFTVYRKVYGITLPRSTHEMAKNVRKIRQRRLQHGDLVFFRTMGRKVSHVGIYIGTERFIHVSSSRGVSINSLNEPYYKKRFTHGGRP